MVVVIKTLVQVLYHILVVINAVSKDGGKWNTFIFSGAVSYSLGVILDRSVMKSFLFSGDIFLLS